MANSINMYCDKVDAGLPAWALRDLDGGPIIVGDEEGDDQSSPRMPEWAQHQLPR